MSSSNLETIPMRLIGRLLEEGHVVERAWISTTVDQELALCVDFTVYPFSLEDGTSQKLRSVVDQAAVCFARHRELKHFFAFVERPNGLHGTTTHFKWKSGDIVRYQRSEIQFQDLLNGSAKREKSDWTLRSAEVGRWASEITRSNISKFSDERKKWRLRTLLNRLPDLLHGAFEYRGVPVASVDIRNDREGILSLYVEFPIDEETENLKPQFIKTIVDCVAPYFREFQGIARLAIWTRPEYEEAMIAISSFYIARHDLLNWEEEQRGLQDLLNKAVDYY